MKTRLKTTAAAVRAIVIPVTTTFLSLNTLAGIVLRPLRIATRKSPLARWQAEWVQQRLAHHGIETELILLTSEGDTHRQVIDGSQAAGLFTKRIQQAVLEDQADLAVHSLKDLPTQIDTGLVLAAVPERGEIADCLVSQGEWSVESLPAGAQVGTGSRRRAAQLLSVRPDLRIVPIRGNVQTRLSYLDLPEFQAVVLAKAGLERLGMEALTTHAIPFHQMLPAPGQGALGIEVRGDCPDAVDAVATLNDPATQLCAAAERSLLRHLKAGCLAPVAGLATIDSLTLSIQAVVLSVDGQQRLHVELETNLERLSEDSSPMVAANSFAKAEQLGVQAAEKLYEQGAEPLISAAH